MQEIIIDEEFKYLLPALDKETYASLEANLLENGCRDALVLWEGILIDGHNRYMICTEHGIPFNTVDMEFGSREEVLIWIISTQLSRRNLSSMQLTHYRGLHYRTDKKIQGTNNQHSQKSEKPHNDVFHSESTAGRLSRQYNVSTSTIDRDAKVSNAIDMIGETSPKAKSLILSGKSKFDKKELALISTRPKDEIAEIALSIENGTYEKKKPEAPAKTDAKNPAIPFPSGPKLPGAAISDITGGFYSELRELANSGDTSELKTALRSFIDMLEDLYRQI